PTLARSLLARREPLEAELLRRQPRYRQRGRHRRRPGQARHRQTRLPRPPPSKQNFPDDSPDPASAVVTADGPGRQDTGRPASTHAATSRWPGSLISGMPASLTTNTVAPALIASTSSGTRDASTWSKKLTMLPPIRTSSALANVRTRRVSSAATTSAAASAAISRGDASDGCPNGVAASNSRP